MPKRAIHRPKQNKMQYKCHRFTHSQNKLVHNMSALASLYPRWYFYHQSLQKTNSQQLVLEHFCVSASRSPWKQPVTQYVGYKGRLGKPFLLSLSLSCCIAHRDRTSTAVYGKLSCLQDIRWSFVDFPLTPVA